LAPGQRAQVLTILRGARLNSILRLLTNRSKLHVEFHFAILPANAKNRDGADTHNPQLIQR
jgi:hypothetical protein